MTLFIMQDVCQNINPLIINPLIISGRQKNKVSENGHLVRFCI